MANYRVSDPTGKVVATSEFDNSSDAHKWFADTKADNTELGWRIEVEHDGEWSFFDDSEGTAN